MRRTTERLWDWHLESLPAEQVTSASSQLVNQPQVRLWACPQVSPVLGQTTTKCSLTVHVEQPRHHRSRLLQWPQFCLRNLCPHLSFLMCICLLFGYLFFCKNHAPEKHSSQGK